MTATCKLGEKGCWNDGKCRATSNCENKVFTNADRIRAMSDEELADMRVRYNPVTEMYINDTDEAYYDFVSAMEAELEWLQQPAEGE